MDTMLFAPRHVDHVDHEPEDRGQPFGEPEVRHDGAEADNGFRDSPYLDEYVEREQAGIATALDRANAALESAAVALGRVTGDREAVEDRLIADAYNAYRKARASAGLAARFLAQGREAAAERCAEHAATQAEAIRALAPDKFADDDGMVAVFADGRKGTVRTR